MDLETVSMATYLSYFIKLGWDGFGMVYRVYKRDEQTLGF